MPPEFDSLRALDNAVEREIAEYLDNHLYPYLFDTFNRVTNRREQRQGKDVISSSIRFNLSNAIIDEKSASHYVNQNLPTFAFELSSLSHGRKKFGWFIDNRKLTDTYLLLWPKADEDKIIYYDFNGKRYPYFCCEDITNIDYVLISRQELLQFLADNHYNEDWLRITAYNIRKKDAEWLETLNTGTRGNGFHFTLSTKLEEQPINVVIDRDVLVEHAICHGTADKTK